MKDNAAVVAAAHLLWYVATQNFGFVRLWLCTHVLATICAGRIWIGILSSTHCNAKSCCRIESHFGNGVDDDNDDTIYFQILFLVFAVFTVIHRQRHEWLIDRLMVHERWRHWLHQFQFMTKTAVERLNSILSSRHHRFFLRWQHRLWQTKVSSTSWCVDCEHEIHFAVCTDSVSHRTEHKLFINKHQIEKYEKMWH